MVSPSISSPTSTSKSKPSSLRNIPLSLRHPSIRYPTSTHVSRVFADTLVSGAADGALTSEETLIRQLDGDLGGRQMGLRSRRGSTTTIRTVRTRRGSMSSTMLQEEEGGSPVAGPSRSSPLDSTTLPDALEIHETERNAATEGSERSRRAVNPKVSSSWLRWNSPAPSFPRSKSPSTAEKGKGKARTDAIEQVDSQATIAPLTATTGPFPDPPPPSTTNISEDPPPADSALKPPDPVAPGPADPAPSKRGWFGWGATVVPEVKVHPEADAGPVVDQEGLDLEASPADPEEPDAPAAEPLEDLETDAPTSDQATGWTSYLWGSLRTKPISVVQEDATAPVDTSSLDKPDPPSTPPRRAQLQTPPPTDTDPDPASDSSADEPTVSENPGWGSYFYPFITPRPTKHVTSMTSSPSLIRPADGPSTEQPPAPAPPPPTTIPGPLPNASLAPPAIHPIPSPSKPSLEPSTSPSSTPRVRQNSAASTSGWLNYLAFRASQKRVTNPSTTSIKSGKERKSTDVNEEIMDFSSDPNFPPSGDASNAASTVPGKKEKPEDKCQSLAPSKPAQSGRQRRASNTSTRSGASSRIPVPSSPKAPSKTPNGKIAKATVSAVPNLVIPSFDTTFSRPPRSLPPLQPQSVITSTTWRALGAVSNYVYGESGGHIDPRGSRAGRRVGNDLPRRLPSDEGWRNVKRIVIVGVHGWFPAKMLNSVIGEPTGTSVKFASMMNQAVVEFFKARGENVEGLRITQMPLEGEGTIEHRVDRLYKAYLSNPAYINDLRRADAIFFAAHSQGCIVTTHLISRMIAQGHIRTPLNRDAVLRCEWAFGPIGVMPDTPKRKRQSASEEGYQKVAMLAMCGVHLGPLYSISTSTVIQPYLQWFENAAARELFEFQESSSVVSMAYQKALSMILENNVKVVLLASLNDQVVPIYGASFSTATHPLLLRALFVDGASYSQTDLMTLLLKFAFMLRNAGISDQRLVEHVSEATAGSLTGLGHSAPYEEIGCYSLAVEYLFLSGPIPSNPGSIKPTPLLVEPFSAKEARNDYELPYLMRAIVDSPEVNDLFAEELKALKDGIMGWKPITKPLKEMKKRLEPMANRHSPLATQVTTFEGPSPSSSAGLKKDW
ncbi:hypothetical protein BD324DRAFT_622237 [Kockovaella imperatae]|uniref:YMC020W-like alpha/beta hydrolase domain-containing protein n=1 Tax=Kockovaella imperatae TaxID=4999 RepID=A0A1Y1UHJ0_9TREE|nr:hypothetical protein BD324DRAFT_622237 [Kockovaella imperatae]ORX37521.1 hypothetical protein BD324DRAFT_622237 [Kockovaella imperatae]